MFLGPGPGASAAGRDGVDGSMSDRQSLLGCWQSELSSHQNWVTQARAGSGVAGTGDPDGREAFWESGTSPQGLKKSQRTSGTRGPLSLQSWSAGHRGRLGRTQSPDEEKRLTVRDGDCKSKTFLSSGPRNGSWSGDAQGVSQPPGNSLVLLLIREGLDLRLMCTGRG